MIHDPGILLKDLRRLVRTLEADIGRELAASPAREAELRAEYDEAFARGRTASAFEPWRDERVTQAAVAWVLSTVFVRFVEDNGLVPGDQLRLAGRGDGLRLARDAQTAYFQEEPHHTDRDYLLDAFRRVAVLPGMAALFDRDHNALYELPVSPDGASDILGFWRRQRDDVPGGAVALVHDFHDDAWETRFLGDLYQDLSDDVKKRYALLQTPEFVEEFILGRTLVPAIKTFGLAETHVLDPTCGSGHFLLGAFDLLIERWRKAEPGTEITLLAQRALDQVAGVDINPYAVAIARFRLLIAALKACGTTRLVDAPDFQVKVAVGDSLLRDPQLSLPGISDDGPASHSYHTEDPEALDAILGRKYEAVVGNPPYITVKDKALNQRYRERYPAACHRQFALTAPFLVRFFQLARSGFDGGTAGFVGMITANSFTKREFGKKLVEQILPELDLTMVVDASGAYIPGHGTPTVLLFGRNQRPRDPHVRMALGIRGEPSKPEEPAKGLVWQAIVTQIDHPDPENPYVSIRDAERSQLAKHPWAMGGGGAAELKDTLDRSRIALKSRVQLPIGRAVRIGADEAFMLPANAVVRSGISPNEFRPYVLGVDVRDWCIGGDTMVWYPYTANNESAFLRRRWFLRALLAGRHTFQGVMEDAGLRWWDFMQHTASAYRTPLSITFAFVTTHNQFVLDRGGKVFKQSAPVIKLPEGATEEEHLRLLGLLNSSVACFWMKQVCQRKTQAGGGGGSANVPFSHQYEFDSTKLQQFPVVEGEVVELARELDRLAAEAAEQTPAAACRRDVPTREALDGARDAWNAIRARQVALQEELDWRCLHLYGVTEEDLTLPTGVEPPPVALGERAFEIVLARRIAAGDEESVWFRRHRSTPVTEVPSHWPEAYRRLVERRIELIETDRDVGLVERPECKRRWATEPWEKQEHAALRGWLLDRLEARELWFDGDEPQVQSVSRLTDLLRRDADAMAVLGLYAGSQADPAGEVEKLVLSDAVPAVAAARYKDSGMVKRRVWERTWDLQRREDAGEDVGDIPVPPKYTSADFRSTVYWQARGKLDVPRERFVLYPGAERDVDRSPVIGWAGWDHLQQVNAVAAYAIERQQTEAWDGERLTPLLAAWHELLPWVRQWHNEPDPRTGRRLGDWYGEHLAVICDELGLTPDDLRGWTPRPKRRGRRAATATPGTTSTETTTASTARASGGARP
jgi:SAM-dependent methyltransferase